MSKIVRNTTSLDIPLTDVGVTVLANNSYLIQQTDFLVWASSSDYFKYLTDEVGNSLPSLVINDGVNDLDASEGVDLIKSLSDSIKSALQEYSTVNVSSEKIKVAISNEPHRLDHQKGGTDELDVTDLSGVLSDQQHIIPSEAVTAMGAKSPNNPLNHDKFQQSEISNLLESQISLNFSTHSNSNDPSTDEKNALSASELPNAGNPLMTKSASDSLYSTLSHTHVNLPTDDQKAALDGSATPSVTNPFATINDLGDSNHAIEVNYSALLLRSGDSVGFPVKVLDDETVTSVFYEAGWYTYNGSGWDFHSSREVHTHVWNDISKAGSSVTDLDVPSKPNNGNAYVLQELNGVFTWILKSTLGGGGSGNRSGVVTIVYDGLSSGDWFRMYSKYIYSERSPWTPPYNCIIREITFSNTKASVSGTQWRITAYEGDLSVVGPIDTTTLAWSVDSNGTNILYNYLDSKIWAYDATSESQTMTLGKGYGFMFERLAGTGKVDDLLVEIHYEEI